VTVLTQFIHLGSLPRACRALYLGGMKFKNRSSRMRNRHLRVGLTLLACVAITGCQHEAQPESKPERTSNTSNTSSGSESTGMSRLSPAARENLERRQSEQERLHNLAQVEVENTLSPYRYVTSTGRYSIFGSLVKASSHSRTIHGSGVTLLAPTDEAFGDFGAWKMMLRQGSQAELDEFVANHVLGSIMTYEEFKTKESHETLGGETFEVDNRGGISFNGAHVRSGHVATENGSVIGMDDVVFVPLSLR
jgi:uncharacterized surface protein with fasciclin (FAS1) repeats